MEDDLDAFLKRYEQLVSAIQDELFKAIAILGGEDIRSLARREVSELMDRRVLRGSGCRSSRRRGMRANVAHAGLTAGAGRPVVE